ncbi:SRPBCC domain-containing protein [Sphaerisporangium sp. TRM90804]|uniref:SRPBCC family protein n=1 Tax=Sphaerisporangium sp. TRM90804 TaxID=3031113 RepID=UPI0024482534|nr:SRPBCC domain-containing protein [Sphaerisporangium sp. TRM90804]MDH2426151.1 SRPBCC domain-containing protein [Sphaerisporangium sp. TRM90804]
MTHRFELRKQIELKAGAEQVWQAVATGRGVDSWFMGRNEIEPRLGGVTRQWFGGFPVEASVTAWEPPRRFAHRSQQGDDGTFMAFEYLVEARDQGGTVLRLVQSGVLGDNWEAEYDALSRGWDMYLHTLDQYLTHFPGRTAVPVFAARPHGGGDEPAWTVLDRGLGLSGEPIAEGDRVRLTPDGLPPVEGIADYVAPDFLGIRTPDALYRFVQGMNQTIVVQHHVFADVDAKETEQAWQNWLTKLFA